jgi:hypothetical protein
MGSADFPVRFFAEASNVGLPRHTVRAHVPVGTVALPGQCHTFRARGEPRRRVRESPFFANAAISSGFTKLVKVVSAGPCFHPLSTSELFERMVRQGLVQPTGKTPKKTLGAALYRHLGKHEETGSRGELRPHAGDSGDREVVGQAASLLLTRLEPPTRQNANPGVAA